MENAKQIEKRPSRKELEHMIDGLMKVLKDDEAVYAAWIILDRAYDRQ